MFASNFQLGAAIFQDGHPVAFYSRKLNSAQRNYTTIEKELLSIVETLKEYRTTLLGCKELHIHTDHRNLTGTRFNTQRIQRWRIFLEEYAPIFHYIQGEHNVLADALSRLPGKRQDDSPATDPDAAPAPHGASPYEQFLHSIMQKDRAGDALKVDADSGHSFFTLHECFLNLPEVTAAQPFPLSFQELEASQTQDNRLHGKLGAEPDNYEILPFGNDSELIVRHGQDGRTRICIPDARLDAIVQWYHQVLSHPGATRLFQTIHQHLDHPTLKEQCRLVSTRCHTCQVEKNSGPGYGHLPPKDIVTEPWYEVAVDMIGPWKVKYGNRGLTFNALTIIDTSTNFLEIIRCDWKSSAYVADRFQQAWLTQYPRPVRVIFDQGTEFVGTAFQNLL